MIGLIRSEFRKLFSTKVWLWLLIGAAALAAGFASLTLGFANNPESGLPRRDDPDLVPIALSAATGAVVFVVILSIIGITQEFRHRTATPTFLTTPRRARVIVAKLVTYVVAGAAYAIVTSLVVLAVAIPWINSSGGEVSLQGRNLSVLLGGALAVALYSLLGVGIGALVRNQVGAIVGVLVYLFVIEPIIRGIPATDTYYRWLPGGAQEALAATAQEGPDLLQRWQGGLLLIGYGLVSAGLAMALTLRRDVH
ncbi:MAG: ABC transporter permease [Geodermatophilaceae bacterium]|nr:ABC transporter permease [Geodermatophilaceae bacterium]